MLAKVTFCEIPRPETSATQSPKQIAQAVCSLLMQTFAAAGLSYTRWGVELATAVEYAGFDNAWQHLAMFKLAQIVSSPLIQFVTFLHKPR